MYAYIPWLLSLSATPNPYPTLLGHYRALSSTPGAQLFTLHSRFPLVIYFIHNSMSNPDLLIRPTAFPCWVYMSILYICLSIPT